MSLCVYVGLTFSDITIGKTSQWPVIVSGLVFTAGESRSKSGSLCPFLSQVSFKWGDLKPSCPSN